MATKIQLALIMLDILPRTFIVLDELKLGKLNKVGNEVKQYAPENQNYFSKYGDMVMY